MSASAVARNYAAALYELAQRDGREAEFGALIDEMGTLYAEDPAFRRFLDAPGVAQSEKKEALRRALAERAPNAFLRFMLVLLDRRRQRVLSGVAAAYRDLMDERAGRVRATVTLPFAADDAVRAEVLRALEKRFETEVIPEFKTDPNILGGVIIRVGDELLDASMRRQLERLKLELR